MKYVVRRGVFETNSSSTHSMVLLSKGSKKEKDFQLKIKKPDEIDVVMGLPDYRTITSKLKKAEVLYQFYILYKDRNLLVPQEDEKEALKKMEEFEKEEYMEIKNDIEEFRKKINKRIDFEATGKYIANKLAGHTYSVRPACDECFQNECLADCTCSMSYHNIAKGLGVDLKAKDAEDQIIDRILDDNVYFVIGENYYGGWYEEDFPSDF